jgi:hypothetical protein
MCRFPRVRVSKLHLMQYDKDLLKNVTDSHPIPGAKSPGPAQDTQSIGKEGRSDAGGLLFTSWYKSRTGAALLGPS